MVLIRNEKKNFAPFPSYSPKDALLKGFRFVRLVSPLYKPCIEGDTKNGGGGRSVRKKKGKYIHCW